MKKSPISITFLGKGEPQGSYRGFLIKGRIVITSANKKLSKYRKELAACVQTFFEDNKLKNPWADKQVAVDLDITFYFEKPKSTTREYPSVRVDIDKLARGALDAFKDLLYVDDGQVVDLVCRKRYGTPERVEIIASIKS